MSEKAEDPNVLGAKLIKAELMGDEVSQLKHNTILHYYKSTTINLNPKELVKSLKERLEKAQKRGRREQKVGASKNRKS